MFFQKALQLASLSVRQPHEALDRLANAFTARAEKLRGWPGCYDRQPFNEIARGLSHALGKTLEPYRVESTLREIETHVLGTSKISGQAAFSCTLNGNLTLARLCYILCRATRPTAVVETGVANGVTSAFILQALEVNGGGTLHSIDLPPLTRGTEEQVGRLVPSALRHRWRLHLGSSKRLLPGVLSEVGNVDMFLHDSLHTYSNMCEELRMVMAFLSGPRLVIADDIEGNLAFHEWTNQYKPSYSGVSNEPGTAGCFGVAVLGSGAV